MLGETQEWEYSLDSVKNLEEAIKIIPQKEFDIILLDLNLPDSIRINTLYAIKPLISNIPVVVLTGLKEDEIGIQAIASGAQDYLNKGEFDSKILKRTIIYAIERKKIEQKLIISELRHKALSSFTQALISNDSNMKQAIERALECLLDVTDTKNALVYENFSNFDNRHFAKCVYMSSKKAIENFDKINILDYQIPEFNNWNKILQKNEILFICKKNSSPVEIELLEQLHAACGIVVPITLVNSHFYGFICFTGNNPMMNNLTAEEIQIFQTASNLLGAYLFRKSLEKGTLDLVEKLQKANEELKELTKMKEDFISVAGHDIRSPFVGIIGFSDILLSEPDLQQKYKDIISIIRKSAEIQLRYVNDLIDIIKLESREFTLKKELYPINSVIEESLQFLLPLAKNKSISFKTTINTNVKISIDYPKIIQVLNNLIGNAIKFTPKGQSIEVKAEIVTGFVEIHVSDTGIGIPEARLNHLFNRYKQIRSSGTDGEKGTGLGLSICKNIVEIHGGNIGVKSIQGKGSDFWFTLPLN